VKKLKKQVRKNEKVLLKNKEDLKYLIFAGIPAGIIMILLSKCGWLGRAF